MIYRWASRSRTDGADGGTGFDESICIGRLGMDGASGFDTAAIFGGTCIVGFRLRSIQAANAPPTAMANPPAIGTIGNDASVAGVSVAADIVGEGATTEARVGAVATGVARVGAGAGIAAGTAAGAVTMGFGVVVATTVRIIDTTSG